MLLGVLGKHPLTKTPGRIPPLLSSRKRLKSEKMPGVWGGMTTLPVISNDFLPPRLHWEIGIYARCLALIGATGLMLPVTPSAIQKQHKLAFAVPVG